LRDGRNKTIKKKREKKERRDENKPLSPELIILELLVTTAAARATSRTGEFLLMQTSQSQQTNLLYGERA